MLAFCAILCNVTSHSSDLLHPAGDIRRGGIMADTRRADIRGRMKGYNEGVQDEGVMRREDIKKGGYTN